MNLTDQEKLRLIGALELACEAEVDKPLGEMDGKLVDTCVRMLLELQGKTNCFSPEHLEEQKNIILEKLRNSQIKKKKVVKPKKILLIAALISLFAIGLHVGTMGDIGMTFLGDFDEKFKEGESMPKNEPFSINGYEVIISDNVRIYETAEKACEKENLNLLVPKNLPDDIYVEKVDVAEVVDVTTVDYIFSLQTLSCHVEIGQSVSQKEMERSERVEINGLVCYVSRLEELDEVQVLINHGGNYYYFGYHDEQVLFDIIENLEEYK
ncbi:MAG: hypothetical protein E7533_05160 [Ruminococcaceae bacterium]|nr:hypothetical protein [Oscillospiraceae bacterium]